jgi:hypothetical protein
MCCPFIDWIYMFYKNSRILFQSLIIGLSVSLLLSCSSPSPVPENDIGEMTQEDIEALEALGYMGEFENENPPPKLIRGTTKYIKDKSFSGLNLYTSGHEPIALLMDMEGETLHSWKVDDFKAIYSNAPRTRVIRFFRRVHLYPNGDLLVLLEPYGMVKLDKDSNILWVNKGHLHHDFQVLDNGNIWALGRTYHVIPRVHEKTPVLEDSMVLLSPEGKEIRQFSLLEAFEKSEGFEKIWKERRKPTGDIFHTNTLEVLDGRVADKHPAFAKGNLLTSMRYLNAVAVVDSETKTVIWAFTEGLGRQHDPKILPNGNMLIFNNRVREEQSQVIEYNVETMEPVWDFEGTQEQPFFTAACGASERLENGNTLITESNNGRGFEITPDGEIVWEFINPGRNHQNPKIITSLLEVIRIQPEYVESWLGVESEQENISEDTIISE